MEKINIKNIVEQETKKKDSNLFNKIKSINTPIKNELLMTLLDGEWHSENELVRIARKKRQYAGTVLVGTMINSINDFSTNIFLKKKVINGKWHFKISDNYVGLTRAAYTRMAYRKYSHNEF